MQLQPTSSLPRTSILKRAPSFEQLAAHSCRAFCTRAGKASYTRLTLSSVVNEPRLILIAALASSGDTPIATRTCDGLMLPLLQAEPPEHAIPLRSSAINSDSLSVPGAETLRTCGARVVLRPWTTASGTRSRIADSSLS